MIIHPQWKRETISMLAEKEARYWTKHNYAPADLSQTINDFKTLRNSIDISDPYLNPEKCQYALGEVINNLFDEITMLSEVK